MTLDPPYRLNTENKTIGFEPSEYQLNLFNRLNNFIENNAFDTDSDNDQDGFNHMVNCKYYSINEFTAEKFCSSRTFSIRHYNIHSIERHIEEFRVSLQMSDFDFDIICISESKIVNGSDPKVDISIPNYQIPISTPTDGTKGGVLIYVKSGINFKPRNDLKIYKSKELESAFIEVINTNESNDIIGIIYRHPCMHENDFIDNYLTEVVNKVSKTNKKVYIVGDFNFNLLNVSTHNSTNEFFDKMMSNFLLPHWNKYPVIDCDKCR